MNWTKFIRLGWSISDIEYGMSPKFRPAKYFTFVKKDRKITYSVYERKIVLIERI
ncbi:hypothetical protein M0R04_10050 [Candidatus Dojkabacteria bacterium]|nr:hypothetical protein [Candidatus Dojkabacteria bacterium]